MYARGKKTSITWAGILFVEIEEMWKTDGRGLIGVAEKYSLEIPSPAPIRSERQYEEYLSVLAKLTDKDDLTAEEEKYAEVLVTLIGAYENRHYRIDEASAIEVLRALMEANNFRQKDLVTIFGSESIVSEVLRGKREPNKAHIAKLSKRFRVSPRRILLSV